MSKKKKSTASKKLVIDKPAKRVSKKKSVEKKVVAKVAVAIKVEVHKAKEVLEKKPVTSKTGEYNNVSPTNFAGQLGGAAPYSFPLDTILLAKSALALAHFSPSQEGIKRAVYKKYPSLNPKNKK